jgi:DNA-binding MarR family transcriptional regulator
MSSATKAEARRLRELLDAFLAARWAIELNMERVAAAMGLSGSQLLVLLDVHEHPGTGLSELCRRTGQKKSAASKLVDSLIGKGLVRREEAAGDRRAVSLNVDRALLELGFCSAKSMEALFPLWKRLRSGEAEPEAIAQALRELTALAGA